MSFNAIARKPKVFIIANPVILGAENLAQGQDGLTAESGQALSVDIQSDTLIAEIAEGASIE